MLDYIKKLITPDMVSLWVPSGQNRAIDLIRGNHGQCDGTHPNVPVISPPIDQISACDATTGWTGTALSNDTADKKEGTGSLKDTVVTPAAATYYNTTYDPTGSWDWSDKQYMLFWFKCDRANTDFTNARLRIYDTLNNYRTWILTFLAGEWTAFKFLLSTGDGESGTPPDLTIIDKISAQLYTADTTSFYKKIDDVRVTRHPSVINPSVGWHFDGVDDYVNIGSDESLNPGTNDITISMWIKREAISSAVERLYIKREANLKWYDLMLNTDNKVEASIAINYPTIGFDAMASTTAITDTDWHHIVTVFDRDGNGQIYIDAVADGSAVDISANAGNLNPTSNAYVGAFGKDYIAPDRQWFNGYIALPFVANKAWSKAQVANFYLNTKGLFAPRG